MIYHHGKWIDPELRPCPKCRTLNKRVSLFSAERPFEWFGWICFTPGCENYRTIYAREDEHGHVTFPTKDEEKEKVLI